MTTMEYITSTDAFVQMPTSLQQMITSNSVIGIFENAIAFLGIWSYDEWLSQTCAGSAVKKIVKEIYNAQRKNKNGSPKTRAFRLQTCEVIRASNNAIKQLSKRENRLVGQ